MAFRWRDGRNVVRLLLGDDTVLSRELLAALLAKYDIEITDQAFTCQELLQKVRESSPDIILLRGSLPGMETDELCRRMLAQEPGRKILIYEAHGEWHWFTSATGMRMRVRITCGDELANAIHTLATAQFHPFPLDSGEEYQYIRPADAKIKAAGFNETQCKILRLVARGCSNQEIARRLSLQLQTVKNNLNTIFREFGVRNRTEAAIAALRRGILSLQDVMTEPEPSDSDTGYRSN
ncbi:MAG: response regulator transcription factor [Chloroflexi bacterium]|nr:response regulator transcription factor [Chloroflexota bacterium]